jgi:hypothetical protein
LSGHRCRYFEKQAFRAKVAQAGESRERWAAEESRTGSVVGGCTEALVRVTMQARIFRLNCDFLRRRAQAEGSSGGGRAAGAEAKLEQGGGGEGGAALSPLAPASSSSSSSQEEVRRRMMEREEALLAAEMDELGERLGHQLQ